uniref:Uncharacterized protein n=1 Tax=Arundo donax TaxID=35708 RepID=A0A0A9EUH8_ARUDO
MSWTVTRAALTHGSSTALTSGLTPPASWSTKCDRGPKKRAW